MAEGHAQCQQNFSQKEAFPATFPSFLQKLQGTSWTDGPGCAMMRLCQGRGSCGVYNRTRATSAVKIIMTWRNPK